MDLYQQQVVKLSEYRPTGIVFDGLATIIGDVPETYLAQSCGSFATDLSAYVTGAHLV